MAERDDREEVLTDPTPADLDAAAAAARDGDLVVYPTETVYGLGADALDPTAVERVFEAKGRSRTEPLSLAVPDVASALDVTAPTERARAFMAAMLPGPVTIVVERDPAVPAVLTAGRDRVGVRVPDHPIALALLDRVAPLTATSANVSGRPAATTVEALDGAIQEAAAVVLDGGETPGGGSTVVDPGRDEIIRAGTQGAVVRAWLDEH
jgi:L-threonylcarbamoyladenylate synthase